MAERTISRIRGKVRCQRYDMTAHALEEMAEDNLDILDIENAVLNGQITRFERDDDRGIKFVIEGAAVNPEILVGVVGRSASNGRFLIITVYEITG